MSAPREMGGLCCEAEICLSGRSQPFPSIPSRHVCVICLSLPPLFFSGFCGICLILLVVSSNPTHSSF